MPRTLIPFETYKVVEKAGMLASLFGLGPKTTLVTGDDLRSDVTLRDIMIEHVTKHFQENKPETIQSFTVESDRLKSQIVYPENVVNVHMSDMTFSYSGQDYIVKFGQPRVQGDPYVRKGAEGNNEYDPEYDNNAETITNSNNDAPAVRFNVSVASNSNSNNTGFSTAAVKGGRRRNKTVRRHVKSRRTSISRRRRHRSRN